MRAELLRAGADPRVHRGPLGGGQLARHPPDLAGLDPARAPPPPRAGSRAPARAPRRARSRARQARPGSSSPSSTIVHAIAASSSASVPGRMKWCSSASSAVRVRRGSTTTTLPPRSRIARRRPRMFGAVSRLPFETSGFAPSSSRWSQRSTSGIGTDSIVPNMWPGGHLLRHLVDGRRRVEVLRAEHAQPRGAVRDRGQVVRVRVAEVDGDRVLAVLGEDRREPPVDLLERLVPAWPRRARRRGARAASSGGRGPRGAA